MRIAVTGRPGVGKTTLCMRVYKSLKGRMTIGGFVTKELRKNGRRVGFKLIDLSSGKEEWLARVGDGSVRVGKYAVNVEGLERFLESVNTKADLIIIDEVGPMELKSEKFVRFVEGLLDKENLLFTIHLKSKHRLLERIRKEFRVYVIDEANRDKVTEEITEIFEG
ncbi:MAG: NTPase [Archaeoglobus sp.]|uniref:NTPase n=1 Tax=Archaeoglobus sp. TaxID=1872626 RepID=UPI001DC1B2E5|nr:NTPase [Archaeoglobus sp.]MBO8180714.1 NTPase [Archaeoglobus sp.]